jgi:ppGpp synthetase/RelA/SpoT-type nucleotidyltranferase
MPPSAIVSRREGWGRHGERPHDPRSLTANACAWVARVAGGSLDAFAQVGKPLSGRSNSSTVQRVPELPFSKSQVRKLGRRLADSEIVNERDSRLLEQLLGTYAEALSEVEQRLSADLSIAATGRIKNTGTIIEKMRRGGHATVLDNIQDIAGTRIVLDRDADLRDQNALVERIKACFGPASCHHVDRCIHPQSGYRGQHIIVKVGAVPVEIQVRTSLQDLWAQIYERLGDRFGRGIRYGEVPAASPVAALVDRLKRCQSISASLKWITPSSCGWSRSKTSSRGTIRNVRHFGKMSS